MCRCYFNQSNVEFNFNQSIANETNRLQNITTYNCPSGEFATGFQDNGTIICAIDQDTAMNPFNQDLNTTDSPSFQNITVEGNVSSTWFNGLFNWVINLLDSSPAYLTFNGSTLSFDESKLNDTISDLDTNETVRFNALVDGNCETGFVMEGVLHNGTVRCVADIDTTIANETNRLQNITGYDCPSGQFATGFQNNGTVICSTPVGGGVDLMINETDGSEDYLNISNFNLSFNEEQLNSTIDDKITSAQAGACSSSNSVISGGNVVWS